MEKEYDKLSNKLMLFVPYDKNSVLNKIYKMCKVIDRKDTNEGTILTVNYQSDTERQVRNMFGEYELC